MTVRPAPRRYVLGVYLGHDMGACLLCDGAIVAMVEEERLNRYKHGRPNHLAGLWPQFAGRFGYFPWASVRYCLAAAGIGIDDLALIAVGDEIWGSGVAGTIRDIVPVKDPSKVVFVREPAGAAHHFHHALTAFFGSPFESAATLVVDGDGNVDSDGYEAETGYLFHDRQGRHELVFKNRYDDPHIPRSGLGWTYEHVTLLLGFGTPDIFVADAGKTMGLAAYGAPDPGLAAPWFTCDGFRIDFGGFHHWLETHGYAEDLTLYRHQLNSVRVERPDWARNIAFKLQVELEAALLHLARELHRRTGARNLCMAGGVALNSVANARIARETPFEGFYVQPACYDGGQAMGLAFHGHLMLAEHEKMALIAPVMHAYRGRCYSAVEIAETLAPFGLDTADLPNDMALCADAADALAAGQIVGWFQGGSEVGPRALGHRSILAHPGLPDMKDHLNARVKFRESFRPFAPSALIERSTELFDFEGASPFMLQVVPIRPAWIERLPAIAHVDGTARLQTVDIETAPLFHALISAFERRTGLPVVLNTSFNLRGMPIVETARDALECFLLTELDRLYLGRTRVDRPSLAALRPFWDTRIHADVARDTVTRALTLRVESRGGRINEALPLTEALAEVPAGIDGSRSLLALYRQLDLPPDTQASATRLVQKLLRMGVLGMWIGDGEIALNAESDHWWQLPRGRVLRWIGRGADA